MNKAVMSIWKHKVTNKNIDIKFSVHDRFLDHTPPCMPKVEILESQITKQIWEQQN